MRAECAGCACVLVTAVRVCAGPRPVTGQTNMLEPSSGPAGGGRRGRGRRLEWLLEDAALVSMVRAERVRRRLPKAPLAGSPALRACLRWNPIEARVES